MGLVWLRPFLFFTEESLFRDLKLCASFVWRDCYRIYIGVILDNWCSCFKSDYQCKSHNLLWGSGLPSLSSDVFTYIWAVMWPGKNSALFKSAFFPSNLLVRFFLGMQCFFIYIFSSFVLNLIPLPSKCAVLFLLRQGFWFSAILRGNLPA